MCNDKTIIGYKEFLGDKLYFTKVLPYDGPMPLVLYPDNTILYLFDNYVVDIDRKYYIILEVSYKETTYDIKNFVKKYPQVLDI